MKIKLAILERDKGYLDRIVAAFSTKYADKFEIYSFTNQEMAMEMLDSARIDVLVASDVFEIQVEQLPKRCGFAYFVEAMDIESIGEQRAICKFQKADLIYKQILSIYSENAGSISGLRLGDESTKIIVFSSPCGGVGTSTVAVACASYYAKKGLRALYLNLERFGTADVFLNAEGQFDLSDVIYTLKSKKANLSMKLESCVKQAVDGTYFYSATKVALDMLEMSGDDICRLISEIKLSGAYDYIIVDIGFDISKNGLKVYKQSHAVVWVGDGSESSNIKIQRAYKALEILEVNDEMPIINRMSLIYNKFSNKTSKTVGDINVKNVGGAPVFMHASEKQVVQQLSLLEMFDKII